MTAFFHKCYLLSEQINIFIIIIIINISVDNIFMMTEASSHINKDRVIPVERSIGIVAITIIIVIDILIIAVVIIGITIVVITVAVVVGSVGCGLLSEIRCEQQGRSGINQRVLVPRTHVDAQTMTLIDTILTVTFTVTLNTMIIMIIITIIIVIIAVAKVPVVVVSSIGERAVG